MKKYLSVLSIVLILFSCAPKNPNIALITWRGVTTAEQGFMDGLSELGHEVNIKQFDAGQDKEKLQTILENELLPNLESYDIVYTFGTTASVLVKAAIQNRVPQIFNIVTDPVKSGLVKSLEKPGGNISGVSNFISLELQIENAKSVFDFTKLAVLYNLAEENSKIILEKLKTISGIEIIPVPTDPNEEALATALKTLTDKTIEIDAVYLPTDSYIVSNAEMIVSALNDTEIKSIGGIKKYVEAGAVVGTVADYYDLGKTAAGICDKILKGEKAENISIQRPENPKMLTQDTAR